MRSKAAAEEEGHNRVMADHDNAGDPPCFSAAQQVRGASGTRLSPCPGGLAGNEPTRLAYHPCVTSRPRVLLSVATSVDGYIDDTGASPLVLSNDEDWDRVDEVRSTVDAILVGAGTIRSDNPRLLVRSEARCADRVRRGLPRQPAKVTLTNTPDLDPAASFFSLGESRKLVYAADPAVPELRNRLGAHAEVVPSGRTVELPAMLADLAGRGIGRLMVEGGGRIHTAFLTAGLVDELHLVIAPFFVGDADAPRFVRPGRFPNDARHPMELAEVRPIGNVVLLRYLLASEI
jgi:5-amino-6-(5-phosphoribosylamino)uracil reductase